MLGPGDEEAILASGDVVFDSAPDPALTIEFLNDPRHHIAGALIDGRLVGIASGFHYIHPDKPAELWINEVGVADAFQRRGIARKLMNTLLEHSRKMGCREPWVLTETDNMPARKLYAAVGAKEETVVYLTFPNAPE